LLHEARSKVMVFYSVASGSYAWPFGRAWKARLGRWFLLMGWVGLGRWVFTPVRCCGHELSPLGACHCYAPDWWCLGTTRSFISFGPFSRLFHRGTWACGENVCHVGHGCWLGSPTSTTFSVCLALGSQGMMDWTSIVVKGLVSSFSFDG
jgi:hypothetical protein